MNIEQITIDNCEILYNFHREWMADILNKYQATHKMLRREKLWQQVQAVQGAEQKKAAAASLEPQNWVMHKKEATSLVGH